MTSTPLFNQAKKYIPGGVNSPVRAFKAVGGTPIFINNAEGAYLYDCDGKHIPWKDIKTIEESINEYDACSCDTEDTCMKFQNDFVNAYYNVPNDWNCIYGGNIMGTMYKQIAEGVAKTKCALATHGYICNQEYVKAIIPRIYPFLRNEDADVRLKDLFEKN